MGFLSVAIPNNASAYSCGDISTPPHCYGTNIWSPGFYAYNEAQTNVSVRGISGGNGLLNNELQLIQDYNYWVEGGYTSVYLQMQVYPKEL